MPFLRDFADGLGRLIDPAAQARHERAIEQARIGRASSQPQPRLITMAARSVYTDARGERGYIRRAGGASSSHTSSRRSFDEPLRSGRYRGVDPNGRSIPWEDIVPLSQIREEIDNRRRDNYNVGRARINEDDGTRRRSSTYTSGTHSADRPIARYEIEPGPRYRSTETDRRIVGRSESSLPQQSSHALGPSATCVADQRRHEGRSSRHESHRLILTPSSGTERHACECHQHPPPAPQGPLLAFPVHISENYHRNDQYGEHLHLSHHRRLVKKFGMICHICNPFDQDTPRICSNCDELAAQRTGHRQPQQRYDDDPFCSGCQTWHPLLGVHQQRESAQQTLTRSDTAQIASVVDDGIRIRSTESFASRRRDSNATSRRERPERIETQRERRPYGGIGPTICQDSPLPALRTRTVNKTSSRRVVSPLGDAETQPRSVEHSSDNVNTPTISHAEYNSLKAEIAELAKRVASDEAKHRIVTQEAESDEWHAETMRVMEEDKNKNAESSMDRPSSERVSAPESSRAGSKKAMIDHTHETLSKKVTREVPALKNTIPPLAPKKMVGRPAAEKIIPPTSAKQIAAQTPAVKISPRSAQTVAPEVEDWGNEKTWRFNDKDHDTNKPSSNPSRSSSLQTPAESLTSQQKSSEGFHSTPAKNLQETETFSTPPEHRDPVTPQYPIPGAFKETLRQGADHTKEKRKQKEEGIPFTPTPAQKTRAHNQQQNSLKKNQNDSLFVDGAEDKGAESSSDLLFVKIACKSFIGVDTKTTPEEEAQVSASTWASSLKVDQEMTVAAHPAGKVEPESRPIGVSTPITADEPQTQNEEAAKASASAAEAQVADEDWGFQTKAKKNRTAKNKRR